MIDDFEALELPAEIEQEAWMDDALCTQVDGDIFFPEIGGSSRPAKRICNACPVQQECLAYALRKDQRFGVWGGKSEKERRQLKRAS